MPKVAVIIGSKSDEKIGEEAANFLKAFNIDCEMRVISAHRNPQALDEFVTGTDAEMFIAVAGLAAALPGVIASKTCKPVIGVPKEAKLLGLDSLLSIVQMPPGIPVATVGIDNWKNAAILAIEILAMKYPDLIGKLEEERRKNR
ncbi:MAG: 5-(carboxyamino)imidazole ribonucleotide mutase [Candidatus Methanomethylicus sp.]|nr:5-(carboxyamino)imidazole ribonucleotide mutase [Candidatus Methanomethylicus sp.]